MVKQIFAKFRQSMKKKNIYMLFLREKKSLIQETLNLSTNADSSTDTKTEKNYRFVLIFCIGGRGGFNYFFFIFL